MLKSLEEAIKLAKVKVATDSDYVDSIVIENDKAKAVFASRKRNRLTSVTLGYGKIKSPDQEEDDGKAFWKRKHEEQQVEEKKREEQLNLCLEKYTSLQNYVTLLEQRGDKAMKIPTEKERSLDLLKAQKIIKFYETLTGTTVKENKTVDEDKDSYICTTKNSIKKVGSQFQIDLDKITNGGTKAQNLYFRPLANADMLPEYLQSSIEGESIMAPVLMGDVLAALYDDDDNEEGGDNDNEEK